VVATPLGNARDITLRALDVLRSVDAIACEDTRVTAKLLAIHGISRPLAMYHDHNARTSGPHLVERLRRGQRIALVSDAGTPLISDPGYDLVRSCIASGIAVVTVPGVSAVTAALSVAGLPTDRFLFAGFPPSRTGQRDRFLRELATIPATLVLMESPRRLARSVAAMAAAWGPRQAAILRELTKRFEEVSRGTLSQLAQVLAGREAVKGEVVIVVAPPTSPAPADPDEIDRRLVEALAELPVAAAAARVAAATGVPRKLLYRRALTLGRDKE
jgi:16S rRNA (cytidine1402-2'-O)-methyltransferase